MKNRLKKVKGHIPTVEFQGYEDESIQSPFMAAMANPDLMSDEMACYPERDFDAEAVRESYLQRFTEAIATLTPRQRVILAVIQSHATQEIAAKELGIARTTLGVTLLQIKKKISKYINKTAKEQ